jgi:hypothetical protein
MTRLAGRTRHVEENQDAEVTPQSAGLEVAIVPVWRPGHRIDVSLDGSIKIDVVALRLPTTTSETHPQPSQRSPQSRRIWEWRRTYTLGRGVGLTHGAPILTIPTVDHVPFWIRSACRLGTDVRHHFQFSPGTHAGHRVTLFVRPGRRAVSWSVGSWRAATTSTSSGSEHLLQQSPHGSAAAHRAHQQVAEIVLVLTVQSHLGEPVIRAYTRSSVRVTEWCVIHLSGDSENLAGGDDSEDVRRCIDLCSASGQVEGLRGRRNRVG